MQCRGPAVMKYETTVKMTHTCMAHASLKQRFKSQWLDTRKPLKLNTEGLLFHSET